MASFYVYFVSSLPMLHFGARPPVSFVKFMELASDKICDEDIRIIEEVKEAFRYKGEQATLKQWSLFDIALRNELVKIRASHRHIDPDKYVRGHDYIEPHIIHIAMSAHRMQSALEAERFLDQQRWLKLDELSIGHYFDLDFLICYALKLLILERWEKISAADKPRLLDEALN